MFFWFLTLSFLAVFYVFESAAIDYRLVLLGSVLPLAEALVGGPWLLHTLLGPALVLAAVMIGARGQRLRQRRLLGLPIGLLFHQVLDGTWANTALFWWPFIEVDSLGGWNLPEFSRGWTWPIVSELIGIALAVWIYRRFGFDHPRRRHLFRTEGRLDRGVL